MTDANSRHLLALGTILTILASGFFFAPASLADKKSKQVNPAKIAKNYLNQMCECRFKACTQKVDKTFTADLPGLRKQRMRLVRYLLYRAKACFKKAQVTKKAYKTKLTVNRHWAMANHLYKRERNYRDAAKELKKILKLDKSNQMAAAYLVQLSMKGGLMGPQPQCTAPAKSTKTKLDKAAKKAAKAAAKCLAKKKKWQATKQKNTSKLLAKFLKKMPKSKRLWRILAEHKIRSKDITGAIDAYTKTVTLHPRDSWSHYQLYSILLRKYRKGDKSVRKQLHTHLTAYLKRTRNRKNRKYRGAQRTQAELKGGQDAVILFDAIAAYETAWKTKRFGKINQHMAKARKGFEHCVKNQPGNMKCQYFLGLIYASVKASDHYNLPKAKAQFSKVTQGEYAIPSKIQLARAARKENKMSEAIAALQAALKIRGNHPKANLELGVIYKLEGEDEKSVAHLEKAIRSSHRSSVGQKAVAELNTIRPEHPLVQKAWRRGGIRGNVFSSERFKSAITMLEKRFGGVLSNAPEQGVLEDILGKILKNADVDPEQNFKVQLLRTKMVNAFAAPNGNLYFTKGLIDYLKRTFPNRKIDANHDILGHVMAHEVVHVLRQHTVRSSLFRQAWRDSKSFMSRAVVTHVTRIHEIEADREGMVLGFLAGFHPRGGIEFMEARGQKREIPIHRDHPSYDERVHYLEEFWSNDVKYAWMSFQFGLRSLKAANEAESRGDTKVMTHYKKAIDHFRRFLQTLRKAKEVSNNLGLAYAKTGLLQMGNQASPLNRWQSSFSVEKNLAMKFVAVRKKATKRSAGEAGPKKVRVPWELKKAIDILAKAYKDHPHYARSGFNLAAAQLAAGQVKQAGKSLDKVASSRTLDPGSVTNLRGIIYAEQGQLDKAAIAFNKAVSHGSMKQATSYNIARLHAIAGRKAEAKAAYQTYIKAYPKGTWTSSAQQAILKL
jgi:predicted Zn-dependent protease